MAEQRVLTAKQLPAASSLQKAAVFLDFCRRPAERFYPTEFLHLCDRRGEGRGGGKGEKRRGKGGKGWLGGGEGGGEGGKRGGGKGGKG